MREMVFGLDGDLSEEAFVGRLNADLANDLGNLVARATTLIVNLGGGVVPVASEADPEGLGQSVEVAKSYLSAEMDKFAFHRALTALWVFVGKMNQYVDTTQPWALAKDPGARGRLDAVLYHLSQSLWCLGVLLEPFLPDAAVKIRGALGQTGTPKLADAEWGRLAAGTRVQKLSGLFPRVEDRKDTGAPPVKKSGDEPARVTIDDFGKVDLRVAEVLAAEAVPKSKKLLKLTVSLGEERRTVVAGIAEHYEPEQLVGKKVVVVANLAPATLMGIESQGMVLAGSAGQDLGLLILDRDLPPGARVR